MKKPAEFDVKNPTFDLVLAARDAAGHPAPEKKRSLSWVWQNGEKLRWSKDGSLLVFHEACPMHPEGRFWIGKNEVTNGQYRGFLKATGRSAPPSGDDAYPVRASPGGDGGLREVGRPADPQAIAVAGGRVLELRREPRGNTPGEGVAEIGRVARLGGREGLPWPPRQPALFSKGRTPLGVEHLFGNVWELVRGSAPGEYTRMGGSYQTPEGVFKGVKDKKFQEYLLGPDTATLEASVDLGFRIVLEAREP